MDDTVSTATIYPLAIDDQNQWQAELIKLCSKGAEMTALDMVHRLDGEHPSKITITVKTEAQ